MASTSSPYGCQPLSDSVGTTRVKRIPNGIQSGLGSNIFTGQPVKFNPATGTIVPIALATDPICGIFMGCLFTPLGGRPSEQTLWPAGATYDNTNDMFAYIIPAWLDSLQLQVQADGSVTQIQLGQSFNFTNIGAGSTVVGLSQCTVGAAGVAAGQQGQVTLTEFFPGVNSAIGDAFTDLIVSIANPQIVSGGLLSIG